MREIPCFEKWRSLLLEMKSVALRDGDRERCEKRKVFLGNFIQYF
jgi:hypothetical protein